MLYKIIDDSDEKSNYFEHTKCIEFGCGCNFYILKDDELYVLGCRNVTALDKDLNIKWKSPDIAEDGIVFNDVTNDIMRIECEMDPPGGWNDRQIDLRTHYFHDVDEFIRIISSMLTCLHEGY